jgi:exoribonuclease II
VNVFYEEEGAFKTARVLSEAEASMQVEAAHGKRSKIKAANVLLRFEGGLEEFLKNAEREAQALDLDFLWEAAPPEEFSATDLAAEYHGRAGTTLEVAALTLRLHGAPMYFYKKGKGRYKAAPADSLKAALASVERKKRETEQIAAWAAELEALRIPPEIAAQRHTLLYAPDKQSPAFKALEAACFALKKDPAALFHAAGLLSDAHQYFLDGFLFEHFRTGREFPAHPAPVLPADLPLAPQSAFSIDDESTTEIDDAFSVTRTVGGRWRIGIHIAAPGLGFVPGSPLDAIARSRMSTVYMPGDKITMQPDDVVDAFTLAAGHEVPCVSLYAEIEEADGAIALEESRIEKIRMADNLRHQALDAQVTEEALSIGLSGVPYSKELSVLWKFACALEAARGKPSAGNQFRDYNFRIAHDEPTDFGPRVHVSERKRGAPLDKLVAELMIYVNRTWGKLLETRGAAGIYRVKTGSGPQGKVRMTTSALPHIGLNVTHYAWSSSPLRRYVDLVNQWQLIAVLRHEKPPFEPRSEQLLGGIAAFDAAYGAYAEFQERMERYWSLVWLLQNGAVGTQMEMEGDVAREGSVRLDMLPLRLNVVGLPELPPRARVLIAVESVDLWALTASARYRATLRAEGVTEGSTEAPAEALPETLENSENED